jgi:hypothetical protein
LKKKKVTFGDCRYATGLGSEGSSIHRRMAKSMAIAGAIRAFSQHPWDANVWYSSSEEAP